MGSLETDFNGLGHDCTVRPHLQLLPTVSTVKPALAVT